MLSQKTGDDTPVEGSCLVFHPDFIKNYPPAKAIKNYGFFSYVFNEALHPNETSGRFLLAFLAGNKPVAAVCHGPAALIEATQLQPGLLSGKRLTGFTNTEEALVFRSDTIPYKLETRLKEPGADFHSALVPFTSNVEEEGLLITGQNPSSAGPTAKALIKMLEHSSQE